MTDSTIVLGDALTTSRIGFGGMALTSVYGADLDKGAALAVLGRALDAGVTFLDTADIYGQGANEELIGEFLRGRRHEVTLATKFGIIGSAMPGSRGLRGDREYVASAVDASLRRLGTEVIDLYYLHRVDPNTPIEETVSAMADLVRAGKVRHLGLSEVTADELRRAHAVAPIAAVQSEWNVWSRDVETNVVPAAAELGVGFVPYSPLGRGFLAGSVTSSTFGDNDIRHHFPRFSADNLTANQSVADQVADIARQLDATPAQVSLAWLYAKGTRLGLPVVPIPGTSQQHRIVENVGSLALELTPAHLAALDTVAAAVNGARSADPSWISSGRE